MFRCFTISLLAHLTMIVGLLLLSVLQPPARAPKRLRLRLIESRAKAPATALVQPTPQPTPQATPRPTPKPTPKPTPIPTPQPTATPKPKKTPPPKPQRKQAAPEKKVIRKADKIVEEEPTPEPTATPAPKQTPTPPKPTPPPAAPVPTPAPPRRVVEGEQISVELDADEPDLSQTYFLIAIQRIQRHFSPPIKRPGIRCRIRFTILRDGTIVNEQLAASTGSPTLDQFAFKALRDTEKLPPLYEGFKKNSLTVTFTFEYDQD